MKTKLRPGEKIIKTGLANMQRGGDTSGGRLYVTDSRLIFEPHRMNLRRENAELELADIVAVEMTWTKVFGLLPIVPNALLVCTRAGGKHRFTVWNRMAWREVIRRK